MWRCVSNGPVDFRESQPGGLGAGHVNGHPASFLYQVEWVVERDVLVVRPAAGHR